MLLHKTYFSLWIGGNNVMQLLGQVETKRQFELATYGGNDITDPTVFAFTQML
jgi:hypothetical protein